MVLITIDFKRVTFVPIQAEKATIWIRPNVIEQACLDRLYGIEFIIILIGAEVGIEESLIPHAIFETKKTKDPLGVCRVILQLDGSVVVLDCEGGTEALFA